MELLNSNELDKKNGNYRTTKFHSWGGKRNTLPLPVVIRAPFHSWGGKRSYFNQNN